MAGRSGVRSILLVYLFLLSSGKSLSVKLLRPSFRRDWNKFVSGVLWHSIRLGRAVLNV